MKPGGRLTEQMTTSPEQGPSSDSRWPFHRPLALLIIILLVAAAFRFTGLDNFPTPDGATPPGLEHDEVAHWLINQDILAGEHAVYFTEAYGHEALYHYLQAGFGALVGDHALALRLPSAYFGILLVAVAYALARRLFGVRVALWSAAFLAVLFWPIFYSRLALRAISLPVFSGLAAYWWWRAFPGQTELDGNKEDKGNEPERGDIGRRSTTWHLFVAGVLAGLSLHTYMAARAVPIFFALFSIYLFLIHRKITRYLWRGIVMFWLALLTVAAPLVLFLNANPGAEVRIAEVDAPLRALLSGDLRPVLENAIKIAGMFGLRGDPLWRQNIAGQPVFDPVMGFLFYAGIVFSLWRWRDPRHGFLLLWLAASVIPSLVTVDAPSSIRIVNLLPVLMLFALVFVHRLAYLSTLRDKLSTDLGTRIVSWGLGGLLIFSAWISFSGLWLVWPANDEVRFVWQAALTEAAAYLDQSEASGPVAVGGWTPETMDPPTMALTLRRDDLSLRYFDPTQSLIIPASPEGQSIRIVTPSILPFAAALRELVQPWEQPHGEFTVYELPVQQAINPQNAAEATFGDRLAFLGYDVVSECLPETRCEIVTYWRVISPSNEPLRLFLHAVDSGGETVAQDDRLGVPAEHWQAGDIIAQLLTVETTTMEMRLGVYIPQTGERLTTRAGVDHIILFGN